MLAASLLEERLEDVEKSVDSLKTALVVLIVIIALFVIVQITELIYQFSSLRRKPQKQKERGIDTQVPQVVVQNTKEIPSKKKSISESTSKSKKKPKKATREEPSKKLMVHLKLKNDEVDESLEKKKSEKKKKQKYTCDKLIDLPKRFQGKEAGKAEGVKDGDMQKAPPADQSLVPGRNQEGFWQPVAKDSLMIADQRLFAPVEFNKHGDLLLPEGGTPSKSSSSSGKVILSRNAPENNEAANVQELSGQNMQLAVAKDSLMANNSSAHLVPVPAVPLGGSEKVNIPARSDVSTAKEKPQGNVAQEFGKGASIVEPAGPNDSLLVPPSPISLIPVPTDAGGKIITIRLSDNEGSKKEELIQDKALLGQSLPGERMPSDSSSLNTEQSSKSGDSSGRK